MGPFAVSLSLQVQLPIITGKFSVSPFKTLIMRQFQSALLFKPHPQNYSIVPHRLPHRSGVHLWPNILSHRIGSHGALPAQ